MSSLAPTKKAVHFGSGAIGRGFVGLFLHQADYEVVFVDVSDKMVDQINEEGKYTVTEIGADGQNKVVVDNIRAINSRAEPQKVIDEIATADVVTCAVGIKILKFIAPLVAKGIIGRDLEKNPTPLTVIACENAMNNTATLLGHVNAELKGELKKRIEANSQKIAEILLGEAPSDETIDSITAISAICEIAKNLDNYARFANCAVDRIVPDQNGTSGLDIQIEAFYEWVVETPPFGELEPPAIPAIKYVPDLAPYITRKLYTVNTAHATAAYLGRDKGFEYIADVMKDNAIRDLVRGSITESAMFIVDEYKIPEDEQKAYVEKIIARISNPALKDPVDRVGRDPLRKLGRTERLIGPAVALAERGWDTTHLMGAVQKALMFLDVPNDQESHQLALDLHRKKPEDLVKDVCGLTSKDKLYQKVLDLVKDAKVKQEEAHKAALSKGTAENAASRQAVASM